MKAAYESANYQEAIAKYTEAVSYDPSYTEALYQLAHAYRRSGDSENAKATYKKVIELFPDSKRATDSRAYLD